VGSGGEREDGVGSTGAAAGAADPSSGRRGSAGSLLWPIIDGLETIRTC
jgi:hypothetical protein